MVDAIIVCAQNIAIVFAVAWVLVTIIKRVKA